MKQASKRSLPARHPHVSPARLAAARILNLVGAGRAFAVDLLHGRMLTALSDADRRLTAAIALGTLRRQGQLDRWIVQASRRRLKSFDREVLTILRMGAYQIGFLSRVPKAAVVNEAVELAKLVGKRSAAGLVNAVLRKCTPGALQARDSDPTPGQGAVPEWLASRWERNFGRQVATALAAASLRTPPVALRVNGDVRERVEERLARHAIPWRAASYAPSALVLERSLPSALPGESDWLAVIQDEGSQIVGLWVDPQPGERVLDVCAAPGVKTGQLASAMRTGQLVAADRSLRRLAALRKLLPPLPEGLAFDIVRLDAARPLPFGPVFDRVLADVPCSGTGTLGRNPEIKWRLQPADIERLSALQQQILGNALAVLAPRGRLVYATCSLEPEENERVVETVLAGAPGFRRASKQEIGPPHLWPLLDRNGYLHTRPDLHEMDGFFATVILRS